MIKHLVVVLNLTLIGMLILMSACVSESTVSQEDSHSSVESFTGLPKVAEVLNNDILLRIFTDGSVYEAGEKILVTAYVENLHSEPIILRPYKFIFPCDEYILWVFVDPKYSDLYDDYSVPYSLSERNFDLAASYNHVTLQPRQGFTYEAIWDQKIKLNPGDIQAPSGKYIIHSEVIRFLSESETKTLAEVEVEIKIVGAETELVAPQEAREIAYQSPEVQQWLEVWLRSERRALLKAEHIRNMHLSKSRVLHGFLEIQPNTWQTK